MVPASAARLSMGLALLLAPLVVWAQEQPEKPSVMPLIPAADWRLVSSQTAGVDAVEKWGGDPVIEREYGVQSVTERTYQFEDHAAQILLEPAADPSSAYGLLSYYQRGGAAPAGATTPVRGMLLTVSGEDGALMARGPVFIRVSRPTNPPLADEDVRALLVEAGGPPPSPRVMESLPAPLPGEGLVSGSEKYLVGPETARRVLPSVPSDLLGFDQGAEVQAGTYLGGGAGRPGLTGKTGVTLVEISCPTVQLAMLRFNTIEKAIAVNQNRGAGAVYGRRAGTFVLLALNSDSRMTAEKFLDEFAVAKQVSWDQRYPGDKSVVLQMVELVLANMMLVAVLVGFSLLGGVMVFLSKMLARKRLAQLGWPGAGEGGIITLHLD